MQNDRKCCSCIEAKDSSDKYLFPIVPGMQEWAELESHQAMVNQCQIPNKTLGDMCTIGLVDSYYDYPILFTIFAFNNINDGLHQVANEFNGFGELISRDDCTTKLLTRYLSIKPSDIDTTLSFVEQGSLSKKIRYMEVTLAFEPIRSKLTIDECKITIGLAMQKLKEKELNGYGGPSLITSIYLIGNILKQVGYIPFIEFIKNRNDVESFLGGNLNNLMYVTDGNKIRDYGLSFLNQ